MIPSVGAHADKKFPSFGVSPHFVKKYVHDGRNGVLATETFIEGFLFPRVGRQRQKKEDERHDTRPQQGMTRWA